ncbi:MAG: thiamine phosphate synthase [Acidobacteriota bacterium]|nr:thiamine phosphate synthase [Acidobacteriota bacterium]
MFPRLYAIADVEVLARRGVALRAFAQALRQAGVGLVQLRDKRSAPQQVLAHAAVLREVFDGSGCRLILNDRADLAVLAGFDGVHVGQGDLPVEAARRVVGPDRWVGISTHTLEQVQRAAATDADYLAIGPVFATSTKADADPVVGLEGVRQARALTRRPLVAIGGISQQRAGSVLAAGADSVAVISALVDDEAQIAPRVRDFLAALR